jgi:hypothetical protein
MEHDTRPTGLVAEAAPLPKTMTVPDAGREYFNLSRNASYEAAKRGQIPTVRIGRLLRVPIVALERKLAEAGQ